MFANQSLIDILMTGGGTLYVLLLASVISISVIILKIFEFRRKSKVDIRNLLQKIQVKLQRDSIENIVSFCDTFDTPVTNIVKAGVLRFRDIHSSDVKDAMNREILLETVRLEKYTTIVGTIGSVSVYIGLFGTVIGIIRVFHDISLAGSGGISVVIDGVSEALVATAAGLCVAIPAIIAYNFFMKRIDSFVVDMEYTVSAMKEVLDAVLKNEN